MFVSVRRLLLACRLDSARFETVTARLKAKALAVKTGTLAG